MESLAADRLRGLSHAHREGGNLRVEAKDAGLERSEHP